MPKNNYWAKLESNKCYHIYNHTVGTENLFKKEGNEAYFLKKWDKYLSPYFSNYAYCLLPNHFHFLSKAKPINEALKTKIETEGTKRGMAYLRGEVPINVFYESQFASFFKSYTQSINKQEENRFGSLFKAKFRRTLVKDLSDFLHFLCYIHHNSIHHHMAANYIDWKYSSYWQYLSKETAVEVSDTLKVSDTYNSPLSTRHSPLYHLIIIPCFPKLK